MIQITHLLNFILKNGDFGQEYQNFPESVSSATSKLLKHKCQPQYAYDVHIKPQNKMLQNLKQQFKILDNQRSTVETSMKPEIYTQDAIIKILKNEKFIDVRKISIFILSKRFYLSHLNIAPHEVRMHQVCSIRGKRFQKIHA